MTQLKDLVSCKTVCVLRKQVSWVVAPRGLVIDFRHLEGNYHHRLQGYELVN